MVSLSVFQIAKNLQLKNIHSQNTYLIIPIILFVLLNIPHIQSSIYFLFIIHYFHLSVNKIYLF